MSKPMSIYMCLLGVVSFQPEGIPLSGYLPVMDAKKIWNSYVRNVKKGAPLDHLVIQAMANVRKAKVTVIAASGDTYTFSPYSGKAINDDIYLGHRGKGSFLYFCKGNACN